MATSIQLSDPGREETPPRLREDRAAATDELRATLHAFGLTQHRAAKWFGVDARSVRRWRRGDRHIPAGVRIVIRLLAAGAVTAAQVEKAAAIPAPVRANGNAAEPAAAPAVLARAEAATHADPGSTTVAAVLALREASCHWPSGDPGRPGFGFCGELVVAGSYCPKHCRMAYMARRELIRPPPGLGSSALDEHSRQPQASAARRMLRAVH